MTVVLSQFARVPPVAQRVHIFFTETIAEFHSLPRSVRLLKVINCSISFLEPIDNNLDLVNRVHGNILSVCWLFMEQISTTMGILIALNIFKAWYKLPSLPLQLYPTIGSYLPKWRISVAVDGYNFDFHVVNACVFFQKFRHVPLHYLFALQHYFLHFNIYL